MSFMDLEEKWIPNLLTQSTVFLLMRPAATLQWKKMAMLLVPSISPHEAPEHNKWRQQVRAGLRSFLLFQPMDNQFVVL